MYVLLKTTDFMRVPVHGVKWLMCMVIVTMVLHRFEQAVVQEAGF